jgi:hypothetical protein
VSVPIMHMNAWISEIYFKELHCSAMTKSCCWCGGTSLRDPHHES